MGVIGFEQCTNPPRLGAVYAHDIIKQLEYAIWELRRQGDPALRIRTIRRNRRWVAELAVEARSRIA